MIFSRYLRFDALAKSLSGPSYPLHYPQPTLPYTKECNVTPAKPFSGDSDDDDVDDDDDDNNDAKSVSVHV